MCSITQTWILLSWKRWLRRIHTGTMLNGWVWRKRWMPPFSWHAQQHPTSWRGQYKRELRLCWSTSNMTTMLNWRSVWPQDILLKVWGKAMLNVMCWCVLFVCFRSGTDEHLVEKKKLLQDVYDLRWDGEECKRVQAIAKKAELEAKKRSADLRLIAMRKSRAGTLLSHFSCL